MFKYKTFYIRKAVKDDASSVGSRLRKEDAIEMQSFHGNADPVETLEQGIELSTDQCWTIVKNDETPVAIFGVVPAKQGLYAAVWMMGTNDIKRISREFLRNCVDWMDRLHKNHPLIGNVVFAGNKLHIKWLKYMGFNFINKHSKLGTMGLPFYEFIHKG